MTSCWIITEQGLTGTQNQCIALAQACGFQTDLKPIQLRAPWKWVTPWWRHFSPRALVDPTSLQGPPWPDCVIVSGRKAIAAGLWVKRQSQCKMIVVQSPVIKDPQFDLVIAPEHDAYHAPNTLVITGALASVTPALLAQEKQHWQSVFSVLPSPRIAVLIGGNSRAHHIDDAVAAHLQQQFVALAQAGYGMMITCSRRTPSKYRDRWRHALATFPSVFFWDGQGANPYRGMLAWADVMLVTEDSVSMASEALCTAKPVYIVRLKGGGKRLGAFHRALVSRGYARWFEGAVEHWTYTPPQDLDRAVEAVNALKFKA